MINYLKNEGIREFTKIIIMANFLKTYEQTIIRHRIFNETRINYYIYLEHTDIYTDIYTDARRT